MARVLIFSQQFPAYHPRAGQPTNFVKKIWEGIYLKHTEWDQFHGIAAMFGLFQHGMYTPKHHTIRAGHRFKPGDWFSPRVWSGKPYRSKQIIIAPDLQVKKTWDFEFFNQKAIINGAFWGEFKYPCYFDPKFNLLAQNDGLTDDDFQAWFNYKPFSGQIICWHENIDY